MSAAICAAPRAALPYRAGALRAIEARLFDLLLVVRGTVYHPDFRDSFSIKAVLPTLVPDLDYADLPIADGTRSGENRQGAGGRSFHINTPPAAPESPLRAVEELRSGRNGRTGAAGYIADTSIAWETPAA